MSSIFFQFYYDDGSIRPFDADVASERQNPQFEAPPVVTDGLIDIFELSQEQLEEKGLTSASFVPSFITEYTDIAEDDGQGIDGLGIGQNIYWECATIPIEPTELKDWSEKWLQTLRRMDDKERKEIISINSHYLNVILEDLGKIHEQAKCALTHKIGIMLFIAW